MTAALARKRATLGTKDKGFTLIELLVVVLILGVLAAVAIPIFLNQQDGAKDSAVAAQITQAKTAIAVEITNGTSVSDAVAKFKAAATKPLDGYTISADIKVKASTPSATATTFEITGFWAKDAATGAEASVTNHGHTISGTTAASKIKS